MRCARIPILLLALAVFAAAPLAQAQEQTQQQTQQTQQTQQQAGETGTPAIEERIANWEAALDEIDQRLGGEAPTVAELEEIRERVRGIQARAQEAQGPVSQRVTELTGLLGALGDAPAEGEPPEGEQAAAQRRTLQAQLAEAEAQKSVIDVIIARADADLSRITELRSRALAARLLFNGPSIWRGASWAAAWEDARRVAAALAAAPGQWWTSPAVAARLGGAAPYIAVALILAAIAGSLLLRRYMLARFGRRAVSQPPSYPRQFFAACVEGAAQGLVPVAAASAAYLLLLAGGMVVGLFGDILLGAYLAALLYFGITGIARAALAPQHPDWRLVGIETQGARRLSNWIAALTVLVAVDLFIAQSTARFYVTRELLAVYGLIMNGGIAAMTLGLLGNPSWRRISEARANDSFWIVLRFLGRLGLVAVPVMILLGYHRLAEFLTLNIVASAAVLGAASATFALLRSVIEIASDTDYGWGVRLKARLGLRGTGGNLLGFLVALIAELIVVLATAGVLAVVWSVDLASFLDFLKQLWTGVELGEETFALRDVLIVIVVFVILAMIVRRIQRGFDTRARTRTQMDTGLRNALRAGIGYGGTIVAGLIAISAAGLDISNLALIAGALSVGIGFGLQTIVSNFVSGIILLVERPVKEGDWITVDGHEGHVRKISVRSTEIVTFSRASVVVPNSTLISTSVVNWMHQDTLGRIEIAVGVAYGSDTELVRTTLIKVAADHPEILDDPEPYVLFQNFGDSALDFELRCYLANVDDKLGVSSELRFAIDKAFREAGITIPFPQRDLHIKEVPKEE